MHVRAREECSEPERREGDERRGEQAPCRDPGDRDERCEWRQRDSREHAVCRVPARGARYDGEAGAGDRRDPEQPSPRTHQASCDLREPAAQVAQGPGARHVRHGVEVPRRRRRGRVPLERVRVPRVVAGARAAAHRLHDVGDEDEHAEQHHERADRRDHVVDLPQPAVRVRVDAPRHAEQPEHVLREERQVEAHEDRPEVQLPEPLVEDPAEHLREPVVDAAEDRRRSSRRRARSGGARRRSTCRSPPSRSGTPPGRCRRGRRS